MPSAHFINDATHWRERAAEMRALAENLPECEGKTTMLRIAADYEQLARRAQNRSIGPAPTSK